MTDATTANYNPSDIQKILEDLKDNWNFTKSHLHLLKSFEVLDILLTYDEKINYYKKFCKDSIILYDSKSDEFNHSSSNLIEITKILNDLEGLKELWHVIAIILFQIEELKETQWIDINSRKLSLHLKYLIDILENLDSNLHEYDYHKNVIERLNYYLKATEIIKILKTEQLKEHHLKLIMKRMCVDWNFDDLKLGIIWDHAEIQLYDSIIKITLREAEGEMVISDCLAKVKEWLKRSIELDIHQSENLIITDWDALFQQLEDQVNSVSDMKITPYFKRFKHEIMKYELNLNELMSLFKIWADVQKRWIYLKGVFNGTDVSNVLKTQANKFKGADYQGLMIEVSRVQSISEISYRVQDYFKKLKEFSNTLENIEKELEKYLHDKRLLLPRLYFLGDDDLLEILGNNKNISSLQQHLKKMFAGVFKFELDEGKMITWFSSRENEKIALTSPQLYKDNLSLLEFIEKEVPMTIKSLLSDLSKHFSEDTKNDIMNHLKNEKYPIQVLVLSLQIKWTKNIDNLLLKEVSSEVSENLSELAKAVLDNQKNILMRMRCEHLIIEYMHQRDVTQSLSEKYKNNTFDKNSFDWLSQMRFKYDENHTLLVNIANVKFEYGFEYLGVHDKIVQTPLTDRCYLTMTQAMHARLGGSPFGPAGTGKTETVKALAQQLGQFVLVFNCDDRFDFKAMVRIFIGLCRIGAWGCFDEFNRLEEQTLSAVSQEIQTIQEALKDNKKSIKLSREKEFLINPRVAIFITMNPGYAGRSNLPDNLKKLFRSFAMTKPDDNRIAEIMLYSQGFSESSALAPKIVLFFKLCSQQLSSQSHYDFGLRSLKSVLVMAGNIKRNKKKEENADQDYKKEEHFLIQSIRGSVIPRLIDDDLLLIESLLKDVFRSVTGYRNESVSVEEECVKNNYVCGGHWLEKVLQLHSISELNHGLILVGPSGSGKTSARDVLVQSINGTQFVIEPKAISKDTLFGKLDSNTNEWKDGLFTKILREIIQNKIQKPYWIVFDGKRFFF